MSETKDENRTEEDKFLVEVIRYIGACSRDTACRYPAEGSSKYSQESIKELSRRWSIIYRKSDSFVRIVQSCVQQSQILAALCYIV